MTSYYSAGHWHHADVPKLSTTWGPSSQSNKPTIAPTQPSKIPPEPGDVFTHRGCSCPSLVDPGQKPNLTVPVFSSKEQSF